MRLNNVHENCILVFVKKRLCFEPNIKSHVSQTFLKLDQNSIKSFFLSINSIKSLGLLDRQKLGVNCNKARWVEERGIQRPCHHACPAARVCQQPPPAAGRWSTGRRSTAPISKHPASLSPDAAKPFSSCFPSSVSTLATPLRSLVVSFLLEPPSDSE